MPCAANRNTNPAYPIPIMLAVTEGLGFCFRTALGMTALVSADRGPKVRHNAGNDALARGRFDGRECLNSERRSRSLTHPRFARMGSG